MPETSERIAELRRELESNPASRQFYQLGELLRRDGRAAEAMAVLRAGLVHHPRYVAAWVSLGRACLDRTLPRDAAKALHEALELDAHNPVAWRLLGEARLAEGDRFGALDAMQHALQLAPGDEVLRAAVDSLSSETWPPGEPLAREAAPAPPAAPRPAAAAPEPALPAPPPAALPVPPPRAPAAPPRGPFDDIGPIAPAAAAPPPAAGAAMDDPFSITSTDIRVVAGVADVFALPAEPASFADEPFGFAVAPVPAQPAFLAEFEVPLATVAPAAAVPLPEAVAPAPSAPPPGPFEAAEMELASPPAEAIAAPEDEFVPPPAADFASTSAFAAAPVEIAAELETEQPEPPAFEPERVESAPEAGPVAVAEAVAMPGPGPAAPPAHERAPAPPPSRPTLTLARLYLEQQDFPAAIAILERVVTADPDNTEARDLLDLVHDMMAPLPGELPSLSARARKIAALQGWLASLTLGQERMAR